MPLVRYDDRNGLRSVWYGVYTDIGYELARLVRRLEALERNVLAALEFDKVLDTTKKMFRTQVRGSSRAGSPINHAQSSVLIPLTDITGTQPAVLREDSLIIVEVIAFVITASNGWTSEEDFTLGWVVGREVSRVGHIEELDLNGWRGETHTAIPHEIWWEYGAHAAGLCHTVTCISCVSSR